MARLADVLAGWFAAVAPLLLLNIVANATSLYAGQLITWGALALLASPIFGGVVAGALAGRRRGVGGAVLTGGTAAALYVLTLLGVMVGWSRIESAPPPLQSYGAGVALPLVFLAATFVLCALLAGALAARGHGPQARARDARGSAPDARPSVPHGDRPFAGMRAQRPSWQPRAPAPAMRLPSAPVRHAADSPTSQRDVRR